MYGYGVWIEDLPAWKGKTAAIGLERVKAAMFADNEQDAPIEAESLEDLMVYLDQAGKPDSAEWPFSYGAYGGYGYLALLPKLPWEWDAGCPNTEAVTDARFQALFQPLYGRELPLACKIITTPT